MTKREAREVGKSVGLEILQDGDFTVEEGSSEDKFREAFYEIVENRKQYAGDVTEEFRRESEWEGYEEGLEISLNEHCRKCRKNF